MGCMLAPVNRIEAPRSLCLFPLLGALLCLIGASLAHAGAAGASAAQASQKQAALRARIAELTARVAQDLQKRDALAADLRAADLALPDKRQQLEAIQRQRADLDKRRQQLEQERAKVQQRLDEQRSQLAQAVRASYQQGRQSSLRLLLNQENPAMMGRMLAYHGYVGRARAAQIQAIQADVARIQSMDQDLQDQATALNRLGEQARDALQSLEQARAQRTHALSALNQRVEGAHQQIERMQREEKALDALLADLNRVLPEFALGPQKPFAQLRGQLPWPVAGRVAARFHASRGGTMRWNGLLIDAAPSAKVRAPYYGRVVYADWLQGMGLLMIIEHGGGFMSLFGRAEVLYKRVGDSVAPGDVIAAMSGAESPQLYLEIRRGRTALDPQDWLKRQR